MINKIKKIRFLFIEDSLVLLDKAKKSTLFRSAGIYTISNILNSSIPFLLLPILTRYLTPEDYGIASMFTMLVGITNIFIGLSINGAVARQYYEKDSINFSEYIGNCFYILMVSTLAVTTIFMLCPSVISKYTSIPTKWLWAIIVSSVGQFINSIILVIWQVEVKPVNYGLFQILQTLLNFSLSIFLIVSLKMKWEGRIVAQIVATVIFMLIAILFLLKDKFIKLKFNIPYIRNALSFGIPLIPHAFGGLAMTMTGRLLITNMVGIADTGIYTVGTQIGAIIGILATSFNSAYVPWLFGQLKKDNMVIKEKIVKLTYGYFIGITMAAVALSLIAPWFLKFFLGKSFTTASGFVVWVALGAAFNGMYYMVTNYIFYAQKTYLLALTTFLTTILNLFFTYLFITVNGSIGAAQSTTLTLFVLFILTWFLSAKVYKMPWFSFYNKR